MSLTSKCEILRSPSSTVFKGGKGGEWGKAREQEMVSRGLENSTLGGPVWVSTVYLAYRPPSNL